MQHFLSLKKAAGYAVILMGVLLAGAIVFYKQRMLFSDSCFMIFMLLDNHHLMIQEFRYGSFITQMVPLIGVILHFSIKAIMIAYSLSFNLFYFIVVLLLVYRFKQYGLAILMSFYYLLLASQTFFWPNNEIHQGVAWMFLFFGVFNSKTREERKYLFANTFLLFVLALLAISCHHIIIIPFVFLWLFFWIEKDYHQANNKAFIRFSFLLALIIALKIFSIQFGFYDKDKLSGIAKFQMSSFFNILKSSQAKNFLRLCLTNYWITVPVFIAGVVSLFFQKKYKTALLTIIFSAIYFTLICLIFPNYDEKQLFYFESEWMGLSLIIAAPFVFNFLPGLKSVQVSSIVCFIFIIRLAYISATAPTFIKRAAFIETVNKKAKENGFTKVILKETPLLDDIFLMNWGVAYESILSSALNNDKSQVTFLILSEDELKNKLPVSERDFLNSWGSLKCNTLNPFYFHIDTTETYHIINYDELTGK